MTRRANFHSKPPFALRGSGWQPVWPPRRAQDPSGFYAYMLLPGFSLGFHVATLGRSRSTVANYLAAAALAAELDPTVRQMTRALIWDLSHEDGLQMARLRGRSQLPHWSRLAMFEFRKRGASRRQIAAAFHCSPGTVANVLQGNGTAYALLSGERRLTPVQQSPPGQWKR